MLHFESIVKGIKCTWIKRILEYDDAKLEMLKTFVQYRNYNVKQIVKCKLNVEHDNFQSEFYREVFKNWFEVYSKVKENDILNESLWDSKHVQIGNKPAHLKVFINNNILYVRDLINENGKMLSKVELEEKYHMVIKQMEYNSLIHALPKAWKNVNKEKQNLEYRQEIFLCCENSKYVKVEDLYCKHFTRSFLHKLFCKPAAELKWEHYFQTDMLDWSTIYKLAFNITKDTKVQSLQYKILQRIFPCNYWLSKWNKDINDSCRFCNQTDYLEHYFYECQTLNELWEGIRNWWLQNIGCTFNLSAKDVILGVCNAFDEYILEMINFTILLAKYYIMKCRKDETHIELTNFLYFMKKQLEIEITHYKLLNKKESDFNNWKNLYDNDLYCNLPYYTAVNVFLLIESCTL